MRFFSILAVLVSTACAVFLLYQYPDSPESAINSMYIIITSSLIAFLLQSFVAIFGNRSSKNEVSLSIVNDTLKKLTDISCPQNTETLYKCSHCNSTGLCNCHVCSAQGDKGFVEKIYSSKLSSFSLRNRSSSSDSYLKFYKCSCCNGVGFSHAPNYVNNTTTIKNDIENIAETEQIQNIVLVRIKNEIDLIEKKEISAQRICELEQSILDKKIKLAHLNIKSKKIFWNFWRRDNEQ